MGKFGTVSKDIDIFTLAWGWRNEKRIEVLFFAVECLKYRIVQVMQALAAANGDPPPDLLVIRQFHPNDIHTACHLRLIVHQRLK